MNEHDSYFYIRDDATSLGVSRGEQQAYVDDTNLYSDYENLRKYQVAKFYFDKYPSQNMYYEHDFNLHNDLVSEKLKSILSVYNKQAFLRFNERSAIIGDKPKKYYKLEVNKNIETIIDQNKTKVIFPNENKDWTESKYEEVFWTIVNTRFYIKPVFKLNCDAPNIFLLNGKLVVHKSALAEIISSNALNKSATSLKEYISINAFYDKNHFRLIEKNRHKAGLISLKDRSNFDEENKYITLKTKDNDEDSDVTKKSSYMISEKAYEFFNAYNFKKTLKFIKSNKRNRHLIIQSKDVKELVDQQKSLYTLKWSSKVKNKETKPSYDAHGSLEDITLMAKNFSRIYADRVYSIVVSKPIFKKELEPIHFYIEDDKLRVSFSFYKVLVENNITGFSAII